MPNNAETTTSSTLVFRELALEALAPLFNGVEWGKTKVLARDKDGVMLAWVSGGTVWSGLSGSSHAPSQLILVGPGYSRTGKVIATGGRLSKARLEALTEEIDNAFTVGLTERLRLGVTVALIGLGPHKS
ncbi:hypothetical protein LCGC14_0282480 [marine sediment metagenome]|uniref:Uncharacterized protein n=1 Tax=marine sediment metagenome TaxID=412755 RepID=A0A0F9U0I5_9ZZZZ